MSVVLLTGLVMAACGGGDDPPELSPAGEEGRQIAADNSCGACHGNNGQGASGPAWIGLLGSERELTDGTVLTADRDYIVRSILNPSSEVVGGFVIRMPENTLTDDEARLVATYIEELAG
ncbi:MAG: cytochrome c [Actinomycetia bacterium]|nr:cytochrome c [Actinomycetes bacterium]MCP4084449.1 cytochrome c [Actinomycetes bacterium]